MREGIAAACLVHPRLMVQAMPLMEPAVGARLLVVAQMLAPMPATVPPGGRFCHVCHSKHAKGLLVTHNEHKAAIPASPDHVLPEQRIVDRALSNGPRQRAAGSKLRQRILKQSTLIDMMETCTGFWAA